MYFPKIQGPSHIQSFEWVKDHFTPLITNPTTYGPNSKSPKAQKAENERLGSTPHVLYVVAPSTSRQFLKA